MAGPAQRNPSRLRASQLDPARAGESGFAIVVVLLVIVILTLLGTSFLLMAETENRIAENERLSAQALHAAETGTRIAKRWFDRPQSALNMFNPTLAGIDRTLRRIDDDGDPSTAPIQATGSSTAPYYKQGVDLDADGNDDVFEDPYRGSLVDTLLGTEDGPDMRIDESASSAARTLLANLSAALFANYPGNGLRARITLIDVYAPPTVPSGGAWMRFGLGTVKVVARIYQTLPDGTELVLGERMVKVVLNEIPYNLNGSLGPLHSCDTLQWNGEFTMHWGVGTAVGDTDLHNSHQKFEVSLPRAASMAGPTDLLWGYDDGTFTQYRDTIDGLRIGDPWLRFFTGGDLAEATNGNTQPWPFTWTPGNPLNDGDLPYHPGPPGPNPYPTSWDGTHSNMFQKTPVSCPEFEYDLWKSIAMSGGPEVHYYVWQSGTSFSENGVGPVQTFRDITDGETGFFFFDTTDGLKPHDDDADGLSDNLTPKIKISGGTWGTRGMIYLNALDFQSKGVKGRTATFSAPGEPFADVDEDGRWDSGEDWVNLDYPTTLKGLFEADSTDRRLDDGSIGAAPVRNSRGPSIDDEALVWGIVYTNGYYDATGNGVYYGSMVSKQGIGFYSASAGTPDHYWDQSIKDDWPPDDWGLPRVAITRWETDM